MATKQKHEESIFSKGTKFGAMLVFIALIFVPHTMVGPLPMHTWVFIVGVLMLVFSCGGGLVHFRYRRNAKKANADKKALAE